MSRIAVATFGHYLSCTVNFLNCYVFRKEFAAHLCAPTLTVLATVIKCCSQPFSAFFLISLIFRQIHSFHQIYRRENRPIMQWRTMAGCRVLRRTHFGLMTFGLMRWMRHQCRLADTEWLLMPFNFRLTVCARRPFEFHFIYLYTKQHRASRACMQTSN